MGQGEFQNTRKCLIFGGPCRDRTCDHLIKSQMHKSAVQTAITVQNAYRLSHNFFYLGCFYTIVLVIKQFYGIAVL